MANRYNWRLWDTKNKCFDKDFKIEIEPENEKDIIEDEESILMQSTGMIDKNGKEIFEGDIVKDLDEICTIEYIDIKCGFSAVICKVKHKNGNHYLTKDITSDLEVIGNIYENPDLRKDI